MAKRMILVPESFLHRLHHSSPSSASSYGSARDALDREMTKILNNKSLKLGEKWKLYQQVLRRYLNIRDKPVKTQVDVDGGKKQQQQKDFRQGDLAEMEARLFELRGLNSLNNLNKYNSTQMPSVQNYEPQLMVLDDDRVGDDDDDNNFDDVIASPSGVQQDDNNLNQIKGITMYLPKTYKTKAEQLLEFISKTKKVKWDDTGEVSVENRPIRGSDINDIVLDLIRPTKLEPTGWQQVGRVLAQSNIPRSLVTNVQRRKRIFDSVSDGEHSYSKKRQYDSGDDDEPSVRSRPATRQQARAGQQQQQQYHIQTRKGKKRTASIDPDGTEGIDYSDSDGRRTGGKVIVPTPSGEKGIRRLAAAVSRHGKKTQSTFRSQRAKARKEAREYGLKMAAARSVKKTSASNKSTKTGKRGARTRAQESEDSREDDSEDSEGGQQSIWKTRKYDFKDMGPRGAQKRTATFKVTRKWKRFKGTK
jgi:hypothetical protein